MRGKRTELDSLINKLKIYLAVCDNARVTKDQFKLLLTQLNDYTASRAIENNEIDCRDIQQLTEFKGQKVRCL
jgi:hypothetical protein